MKQTDNKLIKLAIQKHATSVYECADLIIQEHGEYRFNFTKDQVKEIIHDMRQATTGHDTPNIALEMGVAYIFLKAEEKHVIEGGCYAGQ